MAELERTEGWRVAMRDVVIVHQAVLTWKGRLFLVAASLPLRRYGWYQRIVMFAFFGPERLGDE